MWRNFYTRHGTVSMVLYVALSFAWYAMFVVLAMAISQWLARPAAVSQGDMVSLGFFFAFGYWQVMPLMTSAIGAWLDVKKLRAFPVSSRNLFQIEILMRTVLLCEMPILTVGAVIGILRNPALPPWCAFAPLLFAVFNIFLGAGIRDLIMRLFQRKRLREALILLFILIAALPALLSVRGLPEGWERAVEAIPVWWLPWSAAGNASLALGGLTPWLVLGGFASAALWFGQWQFRRNLEFDFEAGGSSGAGKSAGLLDRLLGWPSVAFRDPLGTLVEKEIRFLSRTSRFRITFAMGFTFGLIIWLPMAARGGTGGWMSQNFLTVAVAYALLLLSEVAFYNSFGFDRTAAQFYFLVPVRPSLVLMAKNIAAIFFVAVEVALVTAACLALKMPLSWTKFAESLTISAVISLFLLGVGNLGSTRSPRAQNPSEGWKRTAASKSSLLALVIYPFVALPIALAYLARYAFQNDGAFFATIGAGILIAACFYYVALDSACETLERDREKFLTLLSQTDTPAL